MNKQSKNTGINLSMTEAVATLSSIAELDFDREIGFTETQDLMIEGQPVSYRSVQWLRKENADQTVQIIRETFKTILHYLKNFYRKEYSYMTNQQTIDGIKTIMVLVGEAAKKIDKYVTFFKDKDNKMIGSALELKEYKQLQEFYHKKINRKIDEGILGKWILALTSRAVIEKPSKIIDRKLPQAKHVFVDLESVKRDTEYELFFMRKEDGTRFFSPRLIRNIKLVCDFGNYFSSSKKEDPLIHIREWQDKYIQSSARDILHQIGPYLDQFCQEAAKIRDYELVEDLKMSLMALFLSANPSNLTAYNSIKSCSDYFADFQIFLRKVLSSSDYQKLIAYPPTKEQKIERLVLKTSHKICEAFFINLQGFRDLLPLVNELIHQASGLVEVPHSESVSLDDISGTLLRNYQAMTKLLRRHPNGPLVKVIDYLQEERCKEFDVLIQQNIPNHWFNLYLGDHPISIDRIPCPTKQGSINKAVVADEFKEFLREYSTEHKSHLIVNLQDRTSWREHFRSLSVEDLQKHQDFTDNLCVVTLAIDTDFYHQLAPYHNENHAQIFFDQLKEHVQDESGGCFFPSKIKDLLFAEIDSLIDLVHEVFFSSKNVLLREHRLDFIQIFYLLLELKVIELLKPNSISFSCKDGVDIGSVNTALLFTFLKLMQEDNWSSSTTDYLNLMVFGPALFIRERVILPERFNRMVSALRTIEHAKHELGFNRFVKVMKSQLPEGFRVSIPQPSDSLWRKAA